MISTTNPPLMPWSNVRFIASIFALPLVTLVALLLWQSDQRALFRIIQICFGWATIIQMAFILSRVFERGWYEFFAYMLHFVAIGAASLTVTFRLEQYPQDLLYDQLALSGMAGQMMIGSMVLGNGPLCIRVKLDPRVLAACAVVVCSAAMVKFALYIHYVGLAGGHFAIYTEGDTLRDNSPIPIRILAAGAPLIGLLAVTQPNLPRWCRVLGGVAIMLEFAIGIRGRPLYIILAICAILQGRIKLTPGRKIGMVVGAVVGVVALATIGYVREDSHSNVDDFFWMILESLFGVFEAGVFSAQLPNASPLVLSQIVPLLAPTPIGNIDSVAKMISVIYTPSAYLVGYGYSSSALTEITLLFGPVLCGFAYPLVVFGILLLIKAAVTARRTWLFLYGACVLPIGFYIWRSELWQLAVPAIKAAPFIILLLGSNAFARLGNRGPAGPVARLPKEIT